MNSIMLDENRGKNDWYSVPNNHTQLNELGIY